MITAKEYQDFVLQRLDKPKNYDSNMEVLIGLPNEVGELLDIYKKFIRYGRPINEEDVVSEIGDVLFYLIGVMNILNKNISIEQVMKYNYEKLTYRDNLAEIKKPTYTED